MKGMMTIAAPVGVALLASCSWVKSPTFVPATPEKTEQQVEPTPAQQEVAMRLLSEEKKKKEEKQPEAVPEAAPEIAMPIIRDPRSETYREANGEEGDDDASLDPAQQRGLRSPALPKLLPMDINGKLNPGL